MKIKKAYWVYPLNFLIRLLPLSMAHKLGAKIGTILFLIKGRDYRTTKTNISACFKDIEEDEREELTRKSLINFGCSALEIPVIWGKSADTLNNYIHTIHGLEHFEKYKSENKSMLIMTPHIGCWELAGFFFADNLHKMHAIYKPSRFESINRIMRNARETNLNLKMVTAEASSIRTLMNILKNNQYLGILPDQDPGSSGGVLSPFFGIPTNTMTLTSKLALKYFPNIIITYVIRHKDAGFDLYIEPFHYEKNWNTQQFVDQTNTYLERIVRKFPSSYQWNYKRFKRTPNFNY